LTRSAASMCWGQLPGTSMPCMRGMTERVSGALSSTTALGQLSSSKVWPPSRAAISTTSSGPKSRKVMHNSTPGRPEKSLKVTAMPLLQPVLKASAAMDAAEARLALIPSNTRSCPSLGANCHGCPGVRTSSVSVSRDRDKARTSLRTSHAPGVSSNKFCGLTGRSTAEAQSH